MRASLRYLVCGGIVAVMAHLGSACEENQPVCIPKQSVECFCETGERGSQTCKDDGYDYHSCVCAPDAGVTGDAGIDAR